MREGNGGVDSFDENANSSSVVEGVTEDNIDDSKITAYVDVYLWVGCPHCRKIFDLMKKDEDYLFQHLGEDWESVNQEATCPECGKKFIVNRLEY